MNYVFITTDWSTHLVMYMSRVLRARHVKPTRLSLAWKMEEERTLLTCWGDLNLVMEEASEL